MSETTPRIAVETFEDRRHARLAVDVLVNRGFDLDQIGFLAADNRPVIDYPASPATPSHTKAYEGLSAGIAGGAALGGIVGAALSMAVLPGLGPVIAGGILTGLFTGAWTGVAGGGIVGYLIGNSIPEERAKSYEKDFHSGHTLVTVDAGERYDEAVEILRQAKESPEVIELHPGARASRIGSTFGPNPGSGSVFIGE